MALTDKAQEIEDVIQAIVHGVSVDPKRLFTTDDKATLLQQQQLPGEDGGKYPCARCRQLFYASELEIDHITAWSKGGRTVLSNAQLLCRPCNAAKGNR